MIREPVLYLTFDPVLEPLGFSQVVRLVTGLARRGVPYVLVSVERERDLARAEHVARVEGVLRSAGVSWERVPASSATLSARRSAGAWARVARTAARVATRERVSLVHARGCQPAAIACGLRSALGIPYLFDPRGFWIEERSGPGDWFSRAGPYAAGKFVEHHIIERAAAIVTLTALHAADFEARFAGRPRPIEVIPTCADYEAFSLRPSRPGKPLENGKIPSDGRRALEGKTVLGLIGSINRFYMTEASIRLAKMAVAMSSNVHLVILSKQTDDYEALLRRVDFPRDRVTLTAASHDEMPEWLQWIDWGMLLLEDTGAKRGSMPTKLAEFFATGVRPVAFGCNSEMTGWVRRAGSGHLLDGVDDVALRAAAAAVAGPPAGLDVLRQARAITEPHFGLSQGVARYRDLVERLLAGGRGKEREPGGASAASPRREGRHDWAT